MSQTTRKVIIIGLDGVPYDLIAKWTAEGKLPNMASFQEEGVCGRLRSTWIPQSPPAWSSIITGKNPGKHGVFDFWIRRNFSYAKEKLMNSTDRKSKDIWEILSQDAKRVCVINVPGTYPPREINGWMITGLLTPRRAGFVTYPDSLRDLIVAAVPHYKIDLDTAFAEGKEEIFLDDLHLTTENLSKLVHFCLNSEPWDFLMVVFTSTDRIQHSMWKYMDPSHPDYSLSKAQKYGDAILRFFARVDCIVKTIMDEVGEEATVLIVSDHGLGPVHYWIDANTLLLALGFMKLKKDVVTLTRYLLFRLGFTTINAYRILSKLGFASLRVKTDLSEMSRLLSRVFLSFRNVDWTKSVAYAWGSATAQLYVNLQGREPNGIVRPDEYDLVRQKIVSTFEKYVDRRTGQKVFSEIVRSESVFKGPYVDRGPDLLAVPSRGYSVCGPVFQSNAAVEPSFGASGDHTMDGLLMMKGPLIRNRTRLDASCLDIAPTVLYLFGMPIPLDMDGRVLEEAIDPAYLTSHRIERKEVTTKQETYFVFSGDDEKEITAHLRKLGYE